MKIQMGARLMSVIALFTLLGFSQSGWYASAAAQAGTIFVNDDVNDGLTAHWKFDENGSATALDFLGANPAALQGTASQAAANIAPLTVPNPGALVLDGTSGYSQIGSPSAALALSTSFSVAGWVRRTTINTYDAIYDSGTETNKWWIFIADNSVGKDDHLGFGKRGIAEFYSTAAITDANWHHIAVVKSGDSGTNLSFYVDGTASGTAAVGSVAAPSGSARIGALLDGPLAAQFGGNIDDLRLYNRALSAAEVTRLSQGQGCATDGSSWSTAYRELQCALSAAGSGQDIWLASGVYRPGTSNTVSFNLVNGVNLLGGFTGTETLASQRPAFDPNAPLTNLSGDILGDDIPASFSNYSDNSQGVVIAGSGVNAALDGLAVRQGSSPSGGCLQVQAGAVGLTLNNVLVSGCSATGNGGGILSQAPLTLNQVTLSGNRSVSGNGGGLFTFAAVTATHLQVLSNKAVAGGGVQTSGVMNVNGGLFDQNQVSNFDGGGIKSSAALTISGVTFQNNLARFGGGAIESAGPTLTISNSVFTSNTVTIFTGGALDAPVGAVTIDSSSFNLNTSVQDGGAIFMGTGSLNIQGGSFDQNQAKGGNCLPVCSSGNGGAIASAGSLTVNGVTFNNNTARLDGGAISTTGPSAGINAGSFTGNKAGFPADTGNPGLGRGGAIFNAEVLTTNQAAFSANSAGATGGGIFNANQMNDTASTFNGNVAGVGGGGVAFGTGVSTSGHGSFSGSTFTNNTAARGGGLDSINEVTLSGVSFSGNHANGATADGGGLFTSAGVSSLDMVTFNANSAGRFGGGARLTAANIQNATFSGNTAGSEGGGILLSQSSDIASSVFRTNSSNLSGGISMQGLSDRSQTLRVFNSLFYDNQCVSSAGTADMRLFDLNIVLANNTFGRPGVAGQRSVVFFRSNLNVRNNIWSGYSASLTEGQTAVGVSLVEDYNLFFNAPFGSSIPAGAHGLAVDPQFVDPAGANFQLKVTSPAIDSGDGSILPPAVTTDLANQARYQDLPGTPNSGTGSPPIDRGAYEFSPPATYLPMMTR